jgi:galactose-1-phosphate uridylyltransferase
MGLKRDITELGSIVAALPPADRERFERIFQVDSSVGKLNPVPPMFEWIEDQFGSVDAVREQRIVRVTNLVTMEGSLFNELRSKRPMVRQKQQELEVIIQQEHGGAFCRPLESTPEDTFGRVEGRHSVTASNIAKFDGFAGVVIFYEHNPLGFTQESIADYIDTGMAWLHKAHETDEEATYPFWLWNCLWRAGASIVHGHAQMILGKTMHYARVEGLRRAALAYRDSTGQDYFDDLYEAHNSVGLALEENGTRILTYLAPIKDKEVILLSDNLDEGLKSSIYRVLDCYVRKLGVSCFNVAICMPPLGPVEEDWSGFPIVARIVDRGDPFNRTVDMAAMELYASSVLFSDPFDVMEVLRGSMVG